jgi:hypothetical protein
MNNIYNFAFKQPKVMIDKIIALVQQNAGDAVMNNPAIPAQFKSEAVQEAGKEIFSGLQSSVSNGNFQGLTSLFEGNAGNIASNPIVTNIISSVAGKFATKFGISPQIAQQVATNLIPKVISQFVSKTNNPNDKDFDMQDILKNIGGAGGIDVGGLLGKVTGSKDGGGLGDALGKFF